MPKRAKELQPIQVKRITKPGYHPVGGVAGLLLCVKPSGAKSWVLRYSTGETRTSTTGKPYALRRDMGLGPYPDVGLAAARDRAREARDLLYRGIDPVDHRKRQREALKSDRETRKTFAEVWPVYHANMLTGVTKKTRQHWKNSIERYALPVIGSMLVADIEMRHIEEMLRPIWTTKPVMGKKLRQRVERILGFATAKGYRSGDNPARWKDNLDLALPAPSDNHKTQSFRALTLDDAPQFMAELRQREGTAARALEFCILTAVRSGEVRGATWDEIDFERKRWTIPAERMKMDREHTIPLPDAALELLESMPRDSELIFPAPRGGQLSDMSLLAVVKRMAWNDRTTVHGFRSTFKVFADEETDVQDFISELALAHHVSDEVKKAYKRSTVVAKRRRLMREWSRFLGYREAGAKVVEMGAQQ